VTARGPLVWLAGGGTVGHLAPGLALAPALERLGARVAFVTPGEAHEADWFPPDGPARLALAAPRRPRGAGQALLFGPRLGAAVAAGVRRIHLDRPGVVLALGGWPCVPAALAALAAGVPLALLAVDAVAGVVVRTLAPLAARVYLADPAARTGLRARAGRVLVTGPVLRDELFEAGRDPAALGLAEGRLTLFVVGGSLGARNLNVALAQGLAEAARRETGLAERIQVLHSTGNQSEGIARLYAEAGLAAEVVPFVRAVGTAYRTADLVVSRAGAMTCAELAALGVPAVLVPYPHHADRQQFKNARPLVERGGALLLEEAALTPEAVRREVLGLLEDAPRRAAMAERMRVASVPAGSAIAADLLALAGRAAEAAPGGRST
jgi:UDP-N-acetylglucosamine--N-acetylmuramyl-(pentapeptide) pyrophosphoryl-undecaprenol N-acetylglucosamine transferase